jgi:hypothetical protein
MRDPDGFSAQMLTGLLVAGAPQRFLRRLLAEFPTPSAWHASPLLEGEDQRWRDVAPVDPLARTLLLTDDEYPWVFRGLSSPPVLLYVDGDDRLLAPAVCLTGLRAPGALGRSVVGVVTEEAASLAAPVAIGTDAGSDELSARSALERGCRVVLIPACGLDVLPERVRELGRDVVASGGCVATQFPPGTRESSQTVVARSRLLAAVSAPLVVVEADVPSAATRLAAETLRVGAPLVVPFPPPALRRELGARGLLALAGVEHVKDLRWPEDLRARAGVNGFANALPDDGHELRQAVRLFWWLRPRSDDDLLRRASKSAERALGHGEATR